VQIEYVSGDGIAYAQGRFVSLQEAVIPIEDRAHQFGDGIYEVVRIYGGKPHLMAEHLQRFERSASALRLPLERTMANLQSLIEEAVSRSGFLEAQVYFQLSRGIARRDHAFPDVPSQLSLTVRPVDDDKFKSAREQGLRVILAEDIRWKWCYIKSLNLLPNAFIKQQALDSDAHDAIFVRDGFISEATSSNVAVVKDRVIWTHPADESILHGITRLTLLKLSDELGIPVREERFDQAFLMSADEVFLMSTLTEIAPVIQVNGTSVGLSALLSGSVVRILQKAYRQQIAR